MKKLLVWDGDETLWSGTVVEGDSAYISEERLILCEGLCARGVLQSIATRNTEETLAEIVHRYSLDRWFLHNQASMTASKSQMIANILSAYGLSRADEVIFVDDNRFNREEVDSMYRGISTIHPNDLMLAVELQFTKPQYTEEDRMRVQSYRSEQARQDYAKSYGDNRMKFLESCEMQMKVDKATYRQLPRLYDLFKRANQTAAFSHAWNLDDLEHYVAMEQITTAHVQDKFGHYGLVGAIVNDGPWIFGLAISCRLQGRGVGSALLG